MIALAIIVTVVAGVFFEALGANFINFPELGTVVAVAVMGGFIMAEIRKKNKEK